MTEAAIIGIDIGKTLFHLVELDRLGSILWKKKLNRTQLMRHMGTLLRCLVGMEACCGADHLARELSALGHVVRLMAPQFVKPFLKSEKNDYTRCRGDRRGRAAPYDALCAGEVCRAVGPEGAAPGTRESDESPYGLINQIRAFLLERGIVFCAGRRQMAGEAPTLFTDERSTLSLRMRMILQQLWNEWRGLLDADITAVTKEIETIAANENGCRRLLAIPCVGPLVATALVAALADRTGFKRSRDLSAWLGLVPRQHSTGGKSTLLGMSKRGKSHLRRLLICGARSASLQMKREHGLGPWLDQLETRGRPDRENLCNLETKLRVARHAMARDRQHRRPNPPHRNRVRPPRNTRYCPTALKSATPLKGASL